MTRPALPGFTVPNLGRSATTLVTAPSTMRRAVYFADDGGVQFVDALGNVVTVASGTGASLSANNTFTGRNRFAPVVGTGLDETDAALAVDASGAAQTLSAAATGIYGITRVTPGTINGTAPGTAVDFLASVFIAGAPTTGTNLTVSDGVYGLAVVGGLFADAVDLGGTLTFGGSANITKSGDLDVNLSSGSTTVLTVRNGGAGVANITADGSISSGSLVMDGVAGTFSRIAGNLTISTATPAVLSLSVVAAGSLQLGANAAALLGFFGTAPAARPTGVAVSDVAIHAALVTLGLITA